MIRYWDDALKYIRRRRIAHRVACWTFVTAIAVLYLTNFAIRAFVYQDSLLDLFQNFICPVALVAAIYAVDWKHCYTTKFICDQLPAVPMTAFVAPVIAAFFACLFHDPQRDTIDFSIMLLASLSMATAPYGLRNVQRACCVIVAEAIGFILLAARLGYNAAAIVSIFVVAAMLLLALPKLDWYLPDESHIKRKTQLALVMLFVSFLTVLLIEDTQVMESFVICSYGRPGLGSSAAVNNACTDMLFHAKRVGCAECAYPMDSIFSNRVFAYILGTLGWIGVLPLLLAAVVMIISGIYISKRSIRVQHYYAVVFMAIISVQTIGYLLMCAGWDELLFPEICPFLDGNFLLNTIFLFMASKVLPPKQIKLPGDFFENLEWKNPLDDTVEESEENG